MVGDYMPARPVATGWEMDDMCWCCRYARRLQVAVGWLDGKALGRPFVRHVAATHGLESVFGCHYWGFGWL